MKICLLLRVLLFLCLFGVVGCGNKAYFYTDGATVENPWPGTKISDPFIFGTQVLFADGRKITVAIFMNRYPSEKYKDVSIELDCSEFEVLVEGKKLKPLRVMCPLGKEFLELKQINADFATPDGRPLKAVVTVPTIKITSMDLHEQPKELSKFAVTFTRQEYKRHFGVR